MSRLKEAEKALSAARSTREKVEARLAEHDAAVAEAEARATAATAVIEQALADDADPGSLASLRKERRTASALAADLREERSVLANIVEQRKREVEAAFVEVERNRRVGLIAEAQELGAEIRNQLTTLRETVDKTEAVVEALRRSKDAVRLLDPTGASRGPHGAEAAGFSSSEWRALKDALDVHARRELDRARNPAPATTT